VKELNTGFAVWCAIIAIASASVVGDVLLARAMKQVGDVHDLWDRSGLWTVLGRVLGNSNFFLGVAAMAVAFFSLLFALSWGDVSLVAPAAASLTFIGNAFAAKIFLHERVDRRSGAAGRVEGPWPAHVRAGPFARGHFATTVVEIPPRGRKSPFTSAHTGRAQRTTSSSTRFTMFS
jgi:hypothetical protein